MTTTIEARHIEAGDRIRRRSRRGTHEMTVSSTAITEYPNGAAMVTLEGIDELNGYRYGTPRRLAFGASEKLEVLR